MWGVVCFLPVPFVLLVVASIAGHALGVDFTAGRAYVGIRLVVRTVTFLSLCLAARRKARQVGRGDIAAGLGLVPIRRPRLVWLLIGATVVYQAVFLAVLLLFPSLQTLIPNDPFDVQTRQAGLAFRGWSILIICGLGPVGEEMLTRSWLWVGLRRRWGPLATSIVTGLLFLALHLPESRYKPLFILPSVALLGLARHYGGSLRASIAVHVFNNSLATTAELVMEALGFD